MSLETPERESFRTVDHEPGKVEEVRHDEKDHRFNPELEEMLKPREIKVHPRTAAVLQRLEADPKWSRRFSVAGLTGGVGLAVSLLIHNYRNPPPKPPAPFVQPQDPFASEPLPSPSPVDLAQIEAVNSEPVIDPDGVDPAELLKRKEESEAHASIIQPPATSVEAMPKSVWERQGVIAKGEVIYVPIDGRMVSFQFVDKGRGTNLLVDGIEYKQTADGATIRVNKIEVNDGTLTVEGTAMLFFGGHSKWTQADFERFVARKGQAFEFPLFDSRASKALLTRVEETSAK